MAPSPEHRRSRHPGRRLEDRRVRDHNRRLEQLIEVGRTITSEINIERLFSVIMDQTNEIMGTERSTVLVHDPQSQELWSLVATGLQKNEIRVRIDACLAGWVFENRSPAVINDPYADPRFCPEVDRRTGFITHNLICVPVQSKTGDVLGVLQALNRRSEPFGDGDVELLDKIAPYVAIALENARLYDDIKRYSAKLEATLVQLETLERVKGQLTKFVPLSVRKIVEQHPNGLKLDKQQMRVTILFIDIQGFSKITAHHDPQQVNDMVETHFSHYLECIQRYGGEVNETAGDGLMVMFKEGTVENTARSAVRAGLDIVTENRRLNRDHIYPWGPVALHLGMNTGSAYVGCTRMRGLVGERYTYTASGMVTVLAARIGALSADTRLLAGPETVGQVRDACRCEAVGTHRFKNVHDPVPIHWVREWRQSSQRA